MEKRLRIGGIGTAYTICLCNICVKTSQSLIGTFSLPHLWLSPISSPVPSTRNMISLLQVSRSTLPQLHHGLTLPFLSACAALFWQQKAESTQIHRTAVIYSICVYGSVCVCVCSSIQGPNVHKRI